jgi:Flp pilus assembly pilin Flp
MATGRKYARQRGGAALEYILVTTFAAVTGIAALTFIGRVVRDQLVNLATKLGIEEPPDVGPVFGDGSDGQGP